MYLRWSDRYGSKVVVDAEGRLAIIQDNEQAYLLSKPEEGDYRTSNADTSIEWGTTTISTGNPESDLEFTVDGKTYNWHFVGFGTGTITPELTDY